MTGAEVLIQKKIEKKKQVEKRPIKQAISQEQLLSFFRDPSIPFKARLMCAVLYLFALRVSEAIGLTKENFEFKNVYGYPVVICRARNLKNRNKPFKELAVVCLSEVELTCYAFIKLKCEEENILPQDKYIMPGISESRLATAEERERARHYIKNYMRRNVKIYTKVQHPITGEISTQLVRIHPHFWRMQRLTDLASGYGLGKFLDVADLQNFAGWSSLKPAQHYIRPISYLSKILRYLAKTKDINVEGV